MSKRSGSGFGSDRPSKKATGEVVPGASFIADTGSHTIAVAAAHQPLQPEQPQQQHEQSEHSSNELLVEHLVVEPLENEAATTNIETEIVNINIELKKATQEKELVGKSLLALTRSASLEALLNDSNNELIFPVIVRAKSSENPAQYLVSFIEGKEAEIARLQDNRIVLNRRLLLKEEKCQGRNSTRMMFSEPSGNPCRSGLRYVEKILRIEYVGDDKESHDIGLIEKVDTSDNLSEFRIKKNIETWGPCLEMLEAWPKIPKLASDISDPTFFHEFLTHVPNLNCDLMENAWISLFKKMQLSRNSASETTMQQSICTPFIEVFITAAGNVESDEYVADELMSSSLTLSCKVHERDKYKETKLSIKPDAAVTLKRKWDALGIVEMKRGLNVKTKENLRDIDKCTLMAAITAILVGRSVDKSRHYEIAIPLVIFKGSSCHLYGATLDERGIPRIKLVKFPETGKTSSETPSAEHDIAGSPSRVRTELFVVLAIRTGYASDIPTSNSKANSTTPSTCNLPVLVLVENPSKPKGEMTGLRLPLL